jgi:hypothetical protein
MMNDVAFGNDAFPSETFRKKTFGFRFCPGRRAAEARVT